MLTTKMEFSQQIADPNRSMKESMPLQNLGRSRVFSCISHLKSRKSFFPTALFQKTPWRRETPNGASLRARLGWLLFESGVRRLLFVIGPRKETQVAVNFVFGTEGLEIVPGFLEHGVLGAFFFYHFLPRLFKGLKHLG